MRVINYSPTYRKLFELYLFCLPYQKRINLKQRNSASNHAHAARHNSQNMQTFSTNIVSIMSLTPKDLHINQLSFTQQNNLTNSICRTIYCVQLEKLTIRQRTTLYIEWKLDVNTALTISFLINSSYFHVNVIIDQKIEDIQK
jgi:hypothetical protein